MAFLTSKESRPIPTPAAATKPEPPKLKPSSRSASQPVLVKVVLVLVLVLVQAELHLWPRAKPGGRSEVPTSPSLLLAEKRWDGSNPKGALGSSGTFASAGACTRNEALVDRLQLSDR